jgi:hypothetical protein
MPLIGAYCTAVRRSAAVLLGLLLVAACGERSDPSLVARPIAVDPRYRFPPAPESVRHGAPVDTLRCARRDAWRGVHVELFIDGWVVLVPPGVGRGPGCSYPILTIDATGVLLVDPTAPRSLGDLFLEWGVSFGRNRVGPFRGPVAVFVDGRAAAGDPRLVELRAHAEVVVEIGSPRVPPHPGYIFPPGL